MVHFADKQMTVWLCCHVQSIVADFRYSSPLIIIDYVYIGINELTITFQIAFKT